MIIIRGWHEWRLYGYFMGPMIGRQRYNKEVMR
jgi:hypothetical protein